MYPNFEKLSNIKVYSIVESGLSGVNEGGDVYKHGVHIIYTIIRK